ncbi:YggT family protein [Rhodovibrionaceae bacterium A322]
MTDPLAVFPIWVVVVDYALGLVMWTLIGRCAMNIFLPLDSDFFFMKAFVKLTDPILRVFRPITPGFLIDPLIPLFVAWFFFLVRFYVMPWLLGYSVMGMLSFPLEGEITRMLYETFYGK